MSLRKKDWNKAAALEKEKILAMVTAGGQGARLARQATARGAAVYDRRQTGRRLAE